jgi:phenylacetate-coenzyme A ligase PaaK-like adenylate-forming protein
MLHRAFMNGLRGLVASLVVYPLAERLEGRDVRSKRRAFASELGRRFAERRQRSWAALVDLVRFAGANVPYYRDLFARIGFDPEKLTRDPRYFQDLPYLTKDLIHSEGERLLRSDHASFRKHVAKTGGSTGHSAHIVYDQDAADWSSAVTRHARAAVAEIGKAGKIGFRSELHFASKFPEAFPLADQLREYMKCLAMNRSNVFFSSLDPDELEKIWSKIKSIRPYLLHAHPSTIVHLAHFVEAHRGADKAFEIFESSGEMLSRKQRETIARVLRCVVIDRYGLAEVGVVAYQTDPQDTAMVVFDPFCWPEIATVDGSDELPCRDDATGGELVLTAIRNRMMPLVRYRTGDLAVLGETSRGFVIHEMIGRTHDVIELAGRRIPTNYLQDVLDRVGGIRTFQVEIVQGRPVLRIVPEPNSGLEGIRNRLAGWWGDAIDVQFIKPSDLKLQGWRCKFRHLVGAPAATSLDAAMESETASRS